MRNLKYLLLAAALGGFAALSQSSSASPLAVGLTKTGSAASEITPGLVEKVGHRRYYHRRYHRHRYGYPYRRYYRHRYRRYYDDDYYGGYYPSYGYYPYSYPYRRAYAYPYYGGPFVGVPFVTFGFGIGPRWR